MILVCIWYILVLASFSKSIFVINEKTDLKNDRLLCKGGLGIKMFSDVKKGFLAR